MGPIPDWPALVSKFGAASLRVEMARENLILHEPSFSVGGGKRRRGVVLFATAKRLPSKLAD